MVMTRRFCARGCLIMVGKGDLDDTFDVVAKSAGESEADAEQSEIVLRVHVVPGAGRTAVVGKYGHGPGVAALKLRVAAPPKGGRANEAVTDLLATTLGVSKSSVTLISGESSPAKRFRIGPIDPDDVRRLLAGAADADTGGFGNVRGRHGVP
jgi:uncharacterized protein (TIGR00251 family)